MDIYLINLDRDTARRAFMEAQLGRLGVPHTRVPGVLGGTLSGVDAAYYADVRRSHLSPPEIGCLLSHLSVWERIADGASRGALVLEDDVHFTRDFGAFLEQLEIDHDELCVHRLETFGARVTLARKPAFRLGHRAAFRLDTNHGGAAAYVLNRATARHLLRARGELRHLPDVELFDPGRRVVRGIVTYQWTPAPCIQDFLMARTPCGQGFISNLDHDRSDRRAGVLLRPSKLNRRIKALVRPVYTALYSLVLAPRGLQRVEVRFG